MELLVVVVAGTEVVLGERHGRGCSGGLGSRRWAAPRAAEARWRAPWAESSAEEVRMPRGEAWAIPLLSSKGRNG
ncbi:hypothetical protein E2562_022382 [Oryza meyeriana var. granulata]|uniref:DUF834 domain-containing protein n=1 Tax=Oryza meyeriana var. granulata TaxID=110450 RepID=A0A6G1EY02_9ORYZ|nr:hypothetical protein E2562_022382 [Oryza meyeriana var. granulata]